MLEHYANISVVLSITTLLQFLPVFTSVNDKLALLARDSYLYVCTLSIFVDKYQNFS